VQNIEFIKYHGTGNDFIILDGFKSAYDADTWSAEQIKLMCHRNFGIGADGLIICAPSADSDFQMVYYNSDGYQSSMCGNGGRCILHFAYQNQYCSDEAVFEAIDGLHQGQVKGDIISLKMQDVSTYEQLNDKAYFIDTGSPHYVTFHEGVDKLDIVAEGRKIRYNERFKFKGTNVNFVEKVESQIRVRTYERGVEDETLSCGTGVVAASLISQIHFDSKVNSCKVLTKGGSLKVSFESEDNTFKNIWLIGPATPVFRGQIEL